MAKFPGLTKRSGSQNWYVRRKIPLSALPFFPSKSDTLWRSTGTPDHKEAKKQYPLIWAKLDQEFENAARISNPQKIDVLSDDEIERLAQLYLHKTLLEDEERRFAGSAEEDKLALSVIETLRKHGGVTRFVEDDCHAEFGLSNMAFTKADNTIEWSVEHYSSALARGDLSAVEEDVDLVLEGQGLELEPGSAAYRKLAFRLLKATVEASKLLQERHAGNVIDTPPEPPKMALLSQPEDSDSETISSMFEKWKASDTRPLKTVKEFHRHVRRFVEVHGDLQVGIITKRQVSAFRDTVAQLPAHMDHKTRKLPVPKIIEKYKDDQEIKRVSPGAVEKAIRAISAVLGYAVEGDYIESNPASKVKVRGVGKGQTKRKDFELHHLQTIFSSPLFVEGWRTKGAAGEAGFWLPLMSLFSGARLEELGQLLLDDVKVISGIHCIELETFGGDKKIKNDNSRRTVPLHSELIRMGFVKYVQVMRDKGEHRVFPHVTSKANEGETQTSAFSSWWAKYMHEKLMINDVLQPFHGFRHTFKSYCRSSKIAKEYHDSITGHADENVGDGYGSGHPVSVLADEIEKLSFPGVGLSKLSWRQKT